MSENLESFSTPPLVDSDNTGKPTDNKIPISRSSFGTTAQQSRIAPPAPSEAGASFFSGHGRRIDVNPALLRCAADMLQEVPAPMLEAHRGLNGAEAAAVDEEDDEPVWPGRLLATCPGRVASDRVPIRPMLGTSLRSCSTPFKPPRPALPGGAIDSNRVALPKASPIRLAAPGAAAASTAWPAMGWVRRSGPILLGRGSGGTWETVEWTRAAEGPAQVTLQVPVHLARLFTSC